ncbi:MAG: OmpA family protein [Nitrospiraceae bacterium]|nr:OmpA family protein [Nitrospiraceae bacterium]
MKRRRPVEEENPDRWVVSYADFITLLFAFFTALYAISRVDTGKLQMFTGSMRSAFRSAPVSSPQVIEGIVPLPEDSLVLEREASRALAPLKARDDVSVGRSERGVVISIGDRLLFDVGRAAVRESSGPVLSSIASLLLRLPNEVVIEGHTDNIPIGGPKSKYASNWELSTARATAVLQYFLENYPLPPERFSAAGYAEFRPVASNATPEGRAKNRRVDIIILGSGPAKADRKLPAIKKEGRHG